MDSDVMAADDGRPMRLPAFQRTFRFTAVEDEQCRYVEGRSGGGEGGGFVIEAVG